MHTSSKRFSKRERAFTFIELILVIAIISAGYVLLLPSFKIQSTTQVMDTLNRLGSDIRSAFDLAILNHKPYRLVFHLNSGKYWLEETDAESFFLGGGDEQSGKDKQEDLSEKREKEIREEFEIDFEKYTSLAGETYKDTKGDTEIPPMSPVIKAKDKLQRPVWKPVASIEWSQRNLGAVQLIVKDMRAEHHIEAVTLESRDPEENFAHIYFLPKGYVERAYLHIYYLKADNSVDEAQQPWTIITNPYRGEASLESGLVQFDFANPIEEE